jgi:hypothetical protein
MEPLELAELNSYFNIDTFLGNNTIVAAPGIGWQAIL